MKAHEMLERYQQGASLRQIGREAGMTYEGVRKRMIAAGYDEEITRVNIERERQALARRMARRQQKALQRQHDLVRLRTSIPGTSEVLPRPEEPAGPTRSDRIPDDVILAALRAWLLDPTARGRSPGAYERWRARRGKDTVPSAACAIGRFTRWSSAKYWALHTDDTETKSA